MSINLEDRLTQKFGINQTPESGYKKIGLKFNPFPKSGTTNINSSDLLNAYLAPVDKLVEDQVFDYIKHALSPSPINNKDKFLSAVVVGNYGSGKTQLLMYVKFLLGIISKSNTLNRNPYVIYIDNPGVKLSELIGSIISKIGQESFKKYLWSKILSRILKTPNLHNGLKEYLTNEGLFESVIDPFSDTYKASYKLFLDAWNKIILAQRKKREFDDLLKNTIFEVLNIEYNDSVLAQYFYDLVSNDFGINKTWEALITGSSLHLERKEAKIIQTIVDLVKEQGFTDFFILVDEFEDITKGRLKKDQVDNYLHNLRTLLDDHREWALLFAMTGEAMESLKRISPPLADRIGIIQINLTKLKSETEIRYLINNYLNIAKEGDEALPDIFTDDAIACIQEKSDGLPRRLLRICFHLLERLAYSPVSKVIDKAFILNNLNFDFE